MITDIVLDTDPIFPRKYFWNVRWVVGIRLYKLFIHENEDDEIRVLPDFYGTNLVSNRSHFVITFKQTVNFFVL